MNCSDPEEEPESEVDLTSFLERQKAADLNTPILGTSSAHTPTSPSSSSLHPSKGQDGKDEDGDGIDRDLERLILTTRLASGKQAGKQADERKNNKQVLEWDEEMESMQREKVAAEAMRGAHMLVEKSNCSSTQPYLIYTINDPHKTRSKRTTAG